MGRFRHHFTRVAILASAVCGCTASSVGAQTAIDVLTQHNDNGRTGANLAETALKPSTVSPQTFGRLFSLGPVDGQVYAQPLFVSQLSISGVVRNVLIVATEHNSVYA